MRAFQSLNLRSLVFGAFAVALSAGVSFGSAGLLSGCGKSPTINLQSPLPGLPGLPNGKAGGGNNKADGNGVQPPGGNRLMCVNDDTKQAYTLSTLSNATSAGQEIKMVENGAASAGQAIGNVGDITAPHMASVLDTNRARILFMGRSLKDGVPNGSRKLYVGDYSLATGVANVTVLGGVEMNGSALSTANTLGLGLRNYGSSSRGKYLIVPGNGGLRVLDSATLKDLGGLGLNSSSSFWPTIDEDSKTLSVVTGGSGFQVAIYRVNLGSTVSLSNRLATSSSGKFALSPIADLQGGYYWGETSGTQSSSVALVHLKANGSTERATFSHSSSNAHIFPQVGILKQHGDDYFVVAYEGISGSGIPIYDVDAGIALVKLAGGRAVSQSVTDFESDVLIDMQNSGSQGRNFRLSAILSSYDHGMLGMQARSKYGNGSYQFDGTVMFELASQSCSQMDFLSLAN